MILNTLIKHETLIIGDLVKMVNPGILSEDNHLQYLLDELIQSGHIDMLDGIIPCTYTITDKGIKEGKRLTQEVQDANNRRPSWLKKAYN
ncbi:hypothetical protein F0145_25360 [Adhaeribacter rhizoryzae]|uniref:Transcriptional regulator n=2 Tax=Adhaeribacter rhizoryzae TaxID=2607907 RepID=A0A5M6D1H9_9BACT|nr:hypothetical protein F0145_25360 [Adhaeribacter rhizoryzae]